MARKIYRTKKDITNLTIGVVVNRNGKKQQRYFEFFGGIQYPTWKPSTLIVEDEASQVALEKSPSFGLRFELAKVFEEEKKITPKKAVVEASKPKDEVDEEEQASVSGQSNLPEAVKVPQIKKPQTAINDLIKRGANPDELNTIEDVFRVAQKLNVEYPNLQS